MVFATLEFISFISSFALFIISLRWEVSIHLASLIIPIVFFTSVGYPAAIILSSLLPCRDGLELKLVHTTGNRF